jgi:beta-lactamase regulating signal transducer with metallopeptidase domain
MLGEIFYWLFNMSLVASISGLIVLALRAIPRLPRRYACLLWLIPMVRMWIPVGMGSRWSLMTLISKLTTRTVVVWERGDMSFAYTNAVMAANSYFPVTYRINLLEELFHVASLVWLAIAAGILITLTVLYVTTKRELKEAVRWQENVYLSDRVATPALYGMIRPRIVLPIGWEEREDLALILTHERAHARHGDNLWRVLAFLTAAVHWFNPLAWIFLRVALSDLEIRCDERVVRDMTAEEKKNYAQALVRSAANAHERNFFVSAFGGARVRVRIERIFSYRRLSRFSTVCAILLILAMAWVLLTNAK